MVGLWVLLATLATATGIGLALRARDGRIRSRQDSHRETPAVPSLPTAITTLATSATPVEPVTLVQLSTTFCAPCRHARTVMTALADRTTGLKHVDVDITNQPQLIRELGILSTPTTLVLDSAGQELLRINGVPRSAALLDALRKHLPDQHRTESAV